MAVSGQVREADGDGLFGTFDVEFTYDGRDREAMIWTGSRSPRYRKAQTVTVNVDPENPEAVAVGGDVNLPNETQLGILQVKGLLGFAYLIVLGGLIGSVSGGIWLLRAVRVQTSRDGHSWTRYRTVPGPPGSMEVGEWHLWRRAHLRVLHDPRDDASHLTFVVLQGAAPATGVEGLRVGEVDVAGDLSGNVVIRTSRVIVAARRTA